MSSLKFCHNCGVQQTTVAAKFCSSCGTSLQSLSSKPEPQARPAPFMVGRTDDDDDDYIDNISRLDIRINKLEVEIIKDKPVAETVGGLAQNITVTEEPREGPFKGVDNKKFLEDFQKEAGTSRPPK